MADMTTDAEWAAFTAEWPPEALDALAHYAGRAGRAEALLAALSTQDDPDIVLDCLRGWNEDLSYWEKRWHDQRIALLRLADTAENLGDHTGGPGGYHLVAVAGRIRELAG